MALTEKNIANRKKGIGASEAGIVMGLNPNVSPYQLWLIKTGQAEPTDLSEIPQVYWGLIHEDPIAQHYARVMNCKVRRVTNTVFHKEHEFMLCHLDRKIENLSKVLECKFAMFAKDEWGETGSDVVPMAYIVQVQYQLAVTGYEEADLAVLIGGYDFRVYHFKREEKLIAKIIEEVKKFWACVENNIAPPLRDSVDAELAYPNNNGNLVQAEPDILKVVDEYRQARMLEGEFKKQKESLKDKLTLFIKDADGIQENAKAVVTWKKTARGSRTLNVSEARA